MASYAAWGEGAAWFSRSDWRETMTRVFGEMTPSALARCVMLHLAAARGGWQNRLGFAISVSFSLF
jgi:hypothetical protein